MEYTNSSLISYTNISPNKTSPRDHAIDRITPHCYVGQVSIESMAGWLCNAGAQASSNYGIGLDGRIGLFVEEKDRSWCSSNRENDNRAVTIECACDAYEPYKITDTVYGKLIDLMTDICQRNGKSKLLWFGDKEKTLSYIPKSEEMIVTVHRWFANKACPGEYIYSKLDEIVNAVNTRLKVSKPVISMASGLPASKQDFIDKVGHIAKTLYSETKILPSVVIAQCCLETGYGLGADAVELVTRNNLLGMKSNLLNSTWKSYSVWDGRSFDKLTPEVYNGVTKYITDSFRVYKNYENCIRDYEMFLLHVKNGNEYKYRKITALTDPNEVITAISKGGYATDPSYITKVMNIIQENNLPNFDKEVSAGEVDSSPKDEEPVESKWYRVQVGAFSDRSNAERRARQLRDKNFSVIIKHVNKMYKVQVGAYLKLSNAEKQLNKLQQAGFADAFITK